MEMALTVKNDFEISRAAIAQPLPGPRDVPWSAQNKKSPLGKANRGLLERLNEAHKIAFGVLVGSFGTRRIAPLGCLGFNLFRVTAAMEGLATLIRSQIGFQFYRSVANVADEL